MRLLATVIAVTLAITPFSQSYAASSQKHTMVADGQKRNYLLYQPSSLSPDSPAPLVIVLHGGFGSGSQAEKAYGWDKQADSSGFVVAYPDGLNRAWNAGGACCGKPAKNNVDDVGFITKLIEDVSKNAKIDPRRVYLTGMSNGAAMAYRYACEGTYPVAAIGPVSGSLAYDCEKPRAVSVMEIHGMDDQHIPFAGGMGTKGVVKVDWFPVQTTLDKFRQAADCQPPSVIANGAVRTASSSCPDGNEVTLITIDGAGHQWPGGKARSGVVAFVLPAGDTPSTAIDAASKLWEFFQKHQEK